MGKVGCAGILVADLFCGPMPKFPREGQLTVINQMPSDVGGCAANVAIDLARQGIDIDILGCLGDDPDGSMLRSCLGRRGINCDNLVQAADHATSKTVILLIEGHDRRYFHMVGANSEFTVKHIDRNWLNSLEVFYLGGLFAMPGIDLLELAELFEFCRENKVITVVDVVVPQDFEDQDLLEKLLPHIDYFIPNDEEAKLITGQESPLDQLRWFGDSGTNAVIITKGHEGAIAMQDGEFWQSSSYQLTAVDPSGAGDAFASGVIVGITRGWELPKLLQYASAIGASAVREVGTTTSVFTVEEAEQLMEKHPLDIVSSSLA